eukprot:6294386-Amphidinium_carterae.1
MLHHCGIDATVPLLGTIDAAAVRLLGKSPCSSQFREDSTVVEVDLHADDYDGSTILVRSMSVMSIGTVTIVLLLQQVINLQLRGSRSDSLGAWVVQKRNSLVVRLMATPGTPRGMPAAGAVTPGILGATMTPAGMPASMTPVGMPAGATPAGIPAGMTPANMLAGMTSGVPGAK